jgi:hypothetical protein
MNETYQRAGTDWFYAAGWGVMHHLCFHSPPMMSADEWNRLVDAFDVTRLAAQLAEVRAGYLLFTIGQGCGHYCAPNSRYDELTGIRPSKCSRRDLISDLSDAFAKHRIPLLVYVPADGPWADHEARRGLGLSRHWSDKLHRAWPEYRLPQFQQNWEEICREWSVRFGRKVRGWWVDGAYHKKERYPDNEPPNLRTYAAALKAGNPDAIVAFNSGANPLIVAYSEFEEYTSGEMVGNLPVGEAGSWRGLVGDRMPEADYGPVRRYVNGEQYHMLNFLGSEWGTGQPRFPAELVAGYTRYALEQGAVVTWDVPVNPAGSIDQQFLEQLRAIGESVPRDRLRR